MPADLLTQPIFDEAAVWRRLNGDRSAALTKADRIEIVRRARELGWSYLDIEHRTGIPAAGHHPTLPDPQHQQPVRRHRRMRQQKTPRQRAEEQLAVAERHVVRLERRVGTLTGELATARTDRDTAVRRRDHHAKSPDLPNPATTTGDTA